MNPENKNNDANTYPFVFLLYNAIYKKRRRQLQNPWSEALVGSTTYYCYLSWKFDRNERYDMHKLLKLDR